jgi:ubiquinone/menaquinone biosynthesis C-methylase UbiE
MATLNAENLLQLGRNYMESRILLTATELDLFTRLAAQPLTAAQIAPPLRVDLRGLTILLDALAGMELLSKHDGRYRCEPRLARYLSADAPESVLPMLRHTAVSWRKWSQLTEIVRGDAPPLTGKRPPGDLRAFIEAMDVVSGPLAGAIVAAVKPGSARKLLDVGGGPGTYTAAFLRAVPALAATFFDQPDVIEIARERLARAGLLARVTFVGGDFYVDELPAGHDLALLSAIIHQNSPAQNVDLFRKVWRALVPGGRIVVRDHVLKPGRTRPRAGAVFAINMLVSTEGGNCYTFDEIRTALSEAGFEHIRLIQESEQMTGLVEAFKPVP